MNGNNGNIIPPQPPIAGRYRVIGDRSFPVYPDTIEINDGTIINILPNDVNVPRPGVSVGSIGNQRVIIDPDAIIIGFLEYVDAAGEVNQVGQVNGAPVAGAVNEDPVAGGRRRKTRNRRRNRKQKTNRKSRKARN
jgi:hypothetical protein